MYSGEGKHKLLFLIAETFVWVQMFNEKHNAMRVRYSIFHGCPWNRAVERTSLHCRRWISWIWNESQKCMSRRNVKQNIISLSLIFHHIQEKPLIGEFILFSDKAVLFPLKTYKHNCFWINQSFFCVLSNSMILMTVDVCNSYHFLVVLF